MCKLFVRTPAIHQLAADAVRKSVRGYFHGHAWYLQWQWQHDPPAVFRSDPASCYLRS
jgi:hypothetical protein